MSADWILDSRDWTESLGSISRIDALETDWRSYRTHGRIWGRPTGWMEVWLAASLRERAPDFREWMGDNGFTLQTPELVAERSLSREVGLKACRGSWSGDVSAWLQDYQDPIETFQKGASPLVAHRNGSGYQAMGIDSRAGWSREWIRLDLHGTLQRARVADGNPALDGKRPPRFPSWKAGLDGSVEPRSGWRAGMTASLQGATYASELNRPTDLRDGKTDLGAWVCHKRGAIVATAQVDNLLDEHAEDWEDLPQPGRRYSVRLDFEFSKPTKTRNDR